MRNCMSFNILSLNNIVNGINKVGTYPINCIGNFNIVIIYIIFILCCMPLISLVNVIQITMLTVVFLIFIQNKLNLF